jgi:hypothetical protein
MNGFASLREWVLAPAFAGVAGGMAKKKKYRLPRS